MKTWKKAGLTALAGSLVATSAFAGAMTVSGTANLHTLEILVRKTLLLLQVLALALTVLDGE